MLVVFLFFGFINGLKFFCYKDEQKASSPRKYEYKYGKSEKLNKIKNPLFPWDVFYSLLVEEEYEKDYKINKGDIVVDVGAHIGIFTVKASKRVGKKGKVIAIEPEEKNLRYLKRNIEVNNLGNVTIVPKALWSGTGEKKLYIDNPKRHSIVSKRGQRYQLVETESLDNLLGGLDKIDFIKMDIEGAELEALKGMKNVLKNNDVKLAIAAYHPVKGESTHEYLVPELKKLGFSTKLRKGVIYGRKQR